MLVQRGSSNYMTGLVSASSFMVRVEVLISRTGVICRLRRIQSSRYEIGLQMQRNIASETTYTSLVRAFRGKESSMINHS